MNIEKVQVEFYRKKLQRRLELYTKQLRLWKVVVEALKPFDGKKITKRMATAVEKELNKTGEEFNWVYYSTEYGMYHIKISFKLCEEDRQQEQVSVLLGHHHRENIEPFDYELYVVDKNGCYSNLQKYIDSGQGAFDKLDDWTKCYNKIADDYEDLTDEMTKFDCEFLFPTLRIRTS